MFSLLPSSIELVNIMSNYCFDVNILSRIVIEAAMLGFLWAKQAYYVVVLEHFSNFSKSPLAK